MSFTEAMRTTYGNLLGVAGRDLIDVGQDSQKSPGFSEELQNVPSMELLLGGSKQTNKQSSGGAYLSEVKDEEKKQKNN